MLPMNDNVAVADVHTWADELEGIRALIAPRFSRSEPRATAFAYLTGLLSGEERKNSWTLSERAGHRVPDGMQRLLSTADWNPDDVRDDLRDYVARHLGDPAGVLIVDETGFLKKGTRSAGVARQYSGTAGRVENCQIGVFMTYATAQGRTFLDRELYLPRVWTDDPDRSAAAGVPHERGFATKPDLAATMITRALEAGVPARWVTGDSVYDQSYRLRKQLEARGMFYVLAVPVNQRVIAKQGFIGTEYRADDLINSLSGRSWRTRSAGDGSKGHRRYAWARARINGARDPEAEYWLLARRSLADSSEIAYFICHTPRRVALAEMVRVAGTRWAIEETFQTAKGQTGLDHYQVRTYTGWYRHITLSMMAHAYLTVVRSKKGARTPVAAS